MIRREIPRGVIIQKVNSKGLIEQKHNTWNFLSE